VTIRINRGADLVDMWGGQLDFEYAVYVSYDGGVDIAGVGHTVAEAVADARETFAAWRETEDADRYGAFTAAGVA
jgi:hypothetical protein